MPNRQRKVRDTLRWGAALCCVHCTGCTVRRRRQSDSQVGGPLPLYPYPAVPVPMFAPLVVCTSVCMPAMPARARRATAVCARERVYACARAPCDSCVCARACVCLRARAVRQSCVRGNVVVVCGSRSFLVWCVNVCEGRCV
jgi:hypothetical protein